MPVTARLSKLFYDRFGDEIVGELVDWLNQVDASYRSDLRELNELNFARFEAKLEQRVAELGARIDKATAETREFVERRLGEQTRWLFAAWATVMCAVIGLWFRH